MALSSNVILSSKQIALHFYKLVDNTNDQYKCACGNIRKQKANTGWMNLLGHIKAQHRHEYETLTNTKSSQRLLTDLMPSVCSSPSDKAKTAFSWIEWVTMGLKPFNFVEHEMNRKYSALPSISRNTLMKYMTDLAKVVEGKIRDELPDKFALMFDGWSSGTTHYLGVFACYDKNGKSQCALLAFSPLLDESNFSAKNHQEFIIWVVEEVFQKSTLNIIAIIGDNCSTNKSVADLFKVPLVGCASHRFNLAVGHYLANHVPLLEKLQHLMVKLSTLKIAGKLRELTNLRPKLRVVTRWSSLYQQVKRYFELQEHINLLLSKERLHEYLLSPSENQNLEDLLLHLQNFDSVVKSLQENERTLADVRLLFDELILRYPSMEKHLSANAGVVHSPLFESAIVKIQNRQFDSLSQPEINAVAPLKRGSSDEKEVVQISGTVGTSSNFASEILKKRKLSAVQEVKDPYVDCSFILPTSNIAERFFSRAGFSYSDRRQGTLPVNLECQLFLNFNRDFWDIQTVQNILLRL